jgi:hypothetical protein
MKTLNLDGAEIRRAIKCYLHDNNPELYKIIDNDFEIIWSLKKDGLEEVFFEEEELSLDIPLEA